MDGRPAAIVQVLTDAYRSARDASGIAQVIENGVSKIVAIYAEGMTVRPLEVISTDSCGIVITEETSTIDGAIKTWHGIHRWIFDAERCTRFEAYTQTLLVVPPTQDEDSASLG